MCVYKHTPVQWCVSKKKSMTGDIILTLCQPAVLSIWGVLFMEGLIKKKNTENFMNMFLFLVP